MVLDRKCSYTFKASCDKNSTSYFALTYHQDANGWCMGHSRSKKIYTKEVNFYNCFINMDELEANENYSLFPQRFVVNVMKSSECNTGLDTNITVTLQKSDGVEVIDFNLQVPPIQAPSSFRCNII